MTTHRCAHRPVAEEIRIEEYLLRRAHSIPSRSTFGSEAVSEAASRGLDWQRIEAMLGFRSTESPPGLRRLIERAS